MRPEQCRAARALLGLSRESLAEMAGVSRNTIQHFENGIFDPLTETVLKLRSAFVTLSIRFIDDDEGVGVRRGLTIEEVTSLDCYVDRPPAPVGARALAPRGDLTSEEVRAARAILGLSQAEAAKLAGVGQSLLVAFETGRRTPRRDNLRKLREAFELLGVQFGTAEGAAAVQTAPGQATADPLSVGFSPPPRETMSGRVLRGRPVRPTDETASSSLIVA